MRRAALLVSAVLLAACGSTAPTAYSVIESYVTAIGEGNYSNACALIDQSARTALENRTGRHVNCPALLARCLPNEAIAFAHDQTQQLYANINLNIAGRTATGDLSGTAVARTIRRVKLSEARGIWRLTSPGEALAHCRR